LPQSGTTTQRNNGTITEPVNKIDPKIDPAEIEEPFKIAQSNKPKLGFSDKPNVTVNTPQDNSKTDGGWTAIVPHETERGTSKVDDKFGADSELRVADRNQNLLPNKTDGQNKIPNIGNWDAQPKDVADTDTQKITQKNPTPVTTEFSTPTTPITPTTPTVLPLNQDITNGQDSIGDELKEPTPIPPIPAITQPLIDDDSQKLLDDNVTEPRKKLQNPTPAETQEFSTTQEPTIENTTPTPTTPNNFPEATTAEEITKRLNDIEKEKQLLEQMLMSEIDKANNTDNQPKIESNNDDQNVGTARTSTQNITKNDNKIIDKPSDDIARIIDEKVVGKDEAKKTEPITDNKTNTESTETKVKAEDKTETEDKTEAKAKDEEKTDAETESKTEERVEEEEVEGEKVEGESESEIGTLELPDFDLEDAEVIKGLIDPSRVGDPHGVAKIKLMYEEIVNGLKGRNMSGKYERWKEYARSTLRNSAGINTGSELDGRARLSWYQKLYNEPIYSIFESEEFTRKLHDGLKGNHRFIGESMAIIREKLDIPARHDKVINFPVCETPIDAIAEVKRVLISAQMHHSRAISTLTTSEQTELVGNLVSTFVGPGCVNGHTIPSRTYGRKLLSILEKIDRSAMHDAGEAFIPLLNKSLIELLDKLPENALPSVLIGGQTFQRLATSAGDIIIGGRGNNTYDLDNPDFRDVVCVIDLGGDDTYRDGTSGLHRPVMLIMDLHGNDTYSATRPGVQGGTILGVSVLIDVEGDDRYNAVDIAQGSSIGGIGMLFDFDGNDSYKGLRRVQAHALSGVGVLIDRAGQDNYHAAMWAQAFGAPAGFAVLEDTSGNDHYYCGGLYIDSYPEHPGYDGWGQGIGAGIRQVANGGIGVLLEGAGDDVYEVDYFGHGGGYWLGAGFARDFGGNDVRHGTTLTAYNGSPRRENKWTRFANGFGCHYSVGYCFDDEGNDVYGGTIMGTGMAWDLSMGYLCDFNGSDKFTATGGMTQGVGAEGSIGVLFSYGGNDTYNGRNQAYANSNITYHSPSNCGSNFSFVINYGGTDTYGCGAKNNVIVQRGSAGGFLIDRPTNSEAAEEIVKLQKAIELRTNEIAAYDAEQEQLKKEAAAKGRRYIPRKRRPAPLTAEQQRIISAVPDFGEPITSKITSTDTSKK
jgi:hypothetical protein